MISCHIGKISNSKVKDRDLGLLCLKSVQIVDRIEFLYVIPAVAGFR